ncbi:SH3 domain-containing protein [Syncephalastrum racemosum]|uniref:SH3 domain-containing protein n=1 Tax=Syncephalastrum racemosum TaxID=13706 RepID=A0A1X2HCJ3_SYNRA|nr:SH3 domain-containing protein [Syncephalastrum racemosum]
MSDSEYRVLHAYAAQQQDELSMKPGDDIRVLDSSNADWWEVENVETGQHGLVPSTFIEKSGSAAAPQSKEGPALARVLEDYEAQNPGELALWKNGVVTILEEDTPGWYKGDLNGKSGLFPADHVKIIDATEEVEHGDAPSAIDHDGKSKPSFKLAAYGVKQGGIGSILAGGMGLRKKSTKRTSVAEEEHNESAPVVPAPAPAPPAVPTSSTGSSIESTDTRVKAMVLHEYEPESEDELRLMRGEYITITDKLEDQGWWQGTNESGQTGVFPSNFVQVLAEQKPAPRSARARPPTIKTEGGNPPHPASENPMSPSSSSMARPPPVPKSTRPSTLLSNRTSSADQSSTPTAPARPVTSPPLPTRRPPPVNTSGEAKGHKPRQPSIPLVSPDLPPIHSTSTGSGSGSGSTGGFKEDHAAGAVPARPSRPVPTPGTSSSRVIPERASVEIDRSTMAKPPKNFGPKPGGPMPTPPPRTTSSRPTSQASTGSPAIPSARNSMSEHRTSTGDSPLSPPPMPRRSMPLPPAREEAEEVPSPAASGAAPPPSQPRSTAAPTDPVEVKVQELVRREVEQIRQEFHALLDIERAERERLEHEVTELRAQLQ